MTRLLVFNKMSISKQTTPFRRDKMISSKVVNQGKKQECKFPQVKQWQNYNTFALFSSENDAVIIASDDNHENDFVGLKVLDTQANEWVQVKDFEIVIKG